MFTISIAFIFRDITINTYTQKGSRPPAKVPNVSWLLNCSLLSPGFSASLHPLIFLRQHIHVAVQLLKCLQTLPLPSMSDINSSCPALKASPLTAYAQFTGSSPFHRRTGLIFTSIPSWLSLCLECPTLLLQIYLLKSSLCLV